MTLLRHASDVSYHPTVPRDAPMLRHLCLVSLGLLYGLLLSGCNTQPQQEEQATDAPEVVQLTADAVSRNGITLTEVIAKPVPALVVAPAEIQLSPERSAHVAPLVPGQLKQVTSAIGDTVKSGQRLGILRSVALGQARAAYHRGQAMSQTAEANLARQQRLKDEGISSERSLLEAQLRQQEAEAERDAAYSQLQVFGLSGGNGPDMAIRAPIAGTIIRRHATRGENVEPADVLFEIADTSVVLVVAQVYEQDMDKVNPGASASLTLPSHPEQAWEGPITYVAPIVDETTRTLEVRVELDNEDGILRPGLFGRLTIIVGGNDAVVPVPTDAVQTLGGDPVVFVPGDTAHSFRPRKVVLGRHNTELVEIREGLHAGEQVVITGAFLLKSQLMSNEFGGEE